MKKDLLCLAIIAVILVFIISGTKIQSVEDYYLTHLDEITDESETVFLSINCKTVLEQTNWEVLDSALKDEKYVPASGYILEQTEYVLRKNDTVFQILDRAIRHNRIQMECIYNQGLGSNYIQSINHLYESSCGALSGWIYCVNGEFPKYGASKYKLKDGDVIEFLFTCDLGRDVGGGLNQ